jgi:hypothetical protein
MMKKDFLILFFSISYLSAIPGILYADITDYIYPNISPSYSNYGTTGIIQMPSARFRSEGTLGVNWSNSDPYLRGTIIAYPFSWFEATYSYIDINNAFYSNSIGFSGDQTYKDKGFDVKFRLIKETDYLPAVALSIRDIAGGHTFEAEALILSKFYKNLDFTVGLGWGDLSHGSFRNPLSNIDSSFSTRSYAQDGQGGEFSPERYFSGPVGLFAGLEVYLPNTKGLRIKLEYDSTNYLDEAFGRGREASNFAFEKITDTESRFNFGLTYPVTKNLFLQAGYMKGNTFTVSASYAVNYSSRKVVTKVSDPPKLVENSSIFKKVNTKQDLYYYRTLLTNLRDRGIAMQKASVQENTLSIKYAQSRFASHTRAAGRTARVLDEISPDYINKFKLFNVNGGMSMFEMTIDRESFSKNTSTKNFNLAKRNISLDSINTDNIDFKYNPNTPFPAHFYYLEPTMRTQIGGPDGFFFGDVRLQLDTETLFRRNLTLLTSSSIGLINNMDNLKLASDSIIPHVRTDIVSYLRESEGFQIDRVQLNSFHNLSSDIYAKVSAGILEEMFGGIGGEILYRPFNKNYGIGAELWRVQQRDYNMLFDFIDYKTTTGHINLYFIEPNSKIHFTLKGGKFLAGDSGLNFDFARRFESGLSMGAFFSLTDISKREFGEGSFDKGFYFNIPLDIFGNEYKKKQFSWGLKPLTRDGAAYLRHGFYLWGVTEQAHGITLTRDWEDLYE